jgi:peptidoglycan/xylan/chitin deacetylase (PgdA/CDA1 family)
VVEEGGFLYDSDSYADDLPYWNYEHGRPHLILPYSLDNNDLRFSTNGIFTGEDFFDYVRDAFDLLYAEGATTPKMMSVGLHCRLVGRPGRIAGLARFLDHVAAHDDVWITRRCDIAAHWIAEHPALEEGVTGS